MYYDYKSPEQQEIEDFLKSNWDLIDAFNFNELYRKMEDDYHVLFPVGRITELLLKADINPLSYMDRVPYSYLYGSTEVTEIIVPSNCKIIDMFAFYHCNNLKKVIIKEGVEVLDKDCFSNCWSLTDIYLPDSIKEIHRDAFAFTQVSKNFHIHCNENSYAHQWATSFPTLHIKTIHPYNS